MLITKRMQDYVEFFKLIQIDKRLILILLLAVFNPAIVSAQWGVGDTRTDFRHDAGSPGTAAKSGFFVTYNPVNYPTGATGWWHLLDVRHYEGNFAMQFAGNFGDQNLWFRKVNSNATQSWSRLLAEENNRVRLFQNASQLYFTDNHVGYPDQNLNFAEISNDILGYKTLMILGNKSAGARRRVGLWDDISIGGAPYNKSLNVNGGGYVSGDFAIGTDQNYNYKLSVSGGGYFSDKVAIGTHENWNYQLAVNGNAIFTKVIVRNYGAWADYVFSPDYKLTPLSEVEAYVKKNHHLPGIPSAQTVEKEGQDIASIQAELLKKIEELTLHLIEQEKKINQQQIELNILNKKGNY